ncbi:hypothetical protein CMU30_02285 [Elizabethkingia anophelis]|nr:hypothetical protein [Elizabethkingia anophelis]MDV3682205.1 hypothetical protein [Elizabethkingia anophelis]MDV3701861.1 hypothetical protein [Elizabethkingia anophelis]MDV3761167.1 hypothetical protein [Elizabethkingia anophelis]MDV3800363.1 hypothetical protein [Elizabethkingia anophelis]
MSKILAVAVVVGLVQDFLAAHLKINEVYVTSDGQIFLEENRAANYAEESGLTYKPYTRGFIEDLEQSEKQPEPEGLDDFKEPEEESGTTLEDTGGEKQTEELSTTRVETQEHPESVTENPETSELDPEDQEQIEKISESGSEVPEDLSQEEETPQADTQEVEVSEEAPETRGDVKKVSRKRNTTK